VHTFVPDKESDQGFWAKAMRQAVPELPTLQKMATGWFWDHLRDLRRHHPILGGGRTSSTRSLPSPGESHVPACSRIPTCPKEPHNAAEQLCR
jgi:hypothetical protein